MQEVLKPDSKSIQSILEKIGRIDLYYGWVQDPAGNPYIGSVATTNDAGQSYSATKQTVQTTDAYGNMTQVQDFNYGTPGSGQPGSLARTYTYTYL